MIRAFSEAEKEWALVGALVTWGWVRTGVASGCRIARPRGSPWADDPQSLWLFVADRLALRGLLVEACFT
jgi:hypothetical protein